jgi:hypothetical protein
MNNRVLVLADLGGALAEMTKPGPKQFITDIKAKLIAEGKDPVVVIFSKGGVDEIRFFDEDFGEPLKDGTIDGFCLTKCMNKEAWVSIPKIKEQIQTYLLNENLCLPEEIAKLCGVPAGLWIVMDDHAEEGKASTTVREKVYPGKKWMDLTAAEIAIIAARSIKYKKGDEEDFKLRDRMVTKIKEVEELARSVSTGSSLAVPPVVGLNIPRVQKIIIQ